MINTRQSLALLLGALVLVLGVFAVSCGGDPAAAQDPPPGCSNATLNGNYGVFEQGTFIGPIPEGLPFPPPPFPYAVEGVATFTDGNIAAYGPGNVDGIFAETTYTGTYNVSADCTVSGEIKSLATGITFGFEGTITGSGMQREIHYIDVNAPFVGAGMFQRTPQGGCSLQTLKGTYVNLEMGSVPSVPAFLALSATATYDGKGDLSGTATLNNNGVSKTDPYTATYEVNADCRYSDEITFEGQTSHRVGIIMGEGIDQEVHVIYADPGIVATGMLEKK